MGLLALQFYGGPYYSDGLPTLLASRERANPRPYYSMVVAGWGVKLLPPPTN